MNYNSTSQLETPVSNTQTPARFVLFAFLPTTEQSEVIAELVMRGKISAGLYTSWQDFTAAHQQPA